MVAASCYISRKILVRLSRHEECLDEAPLRVPRRPLLRRFRSTPSRGATRCRRGAHDVDSADPGDARRTRDRAGDRPLQAVWPQRQARLADLADMPGGFTV